MKISVIIPAFNAEKWVAQCIENVLHQSYKDLEVIVIDDGSTDSTAEIAARYPVTLLRQENRGPSASRNRGIDAASGEYIHFLDVDDWINLDFYTHMVDAIALTDADMAFGGLIHEAVPRLTRLYTERWLLSAPEDKFSVTNAGMDGYSVRYVFRKSLLEKSNLRFEVGRYIEDLPFTVQAVADASRIVTVPGAIYYYKRRGGSTMRSLNPEVKRKRREDLANAHAIRDKLMEQYGLGHLARLRAVDRLQYKIFGIPMLERRTLNNGKIRWYLFGLRVMQTKQLG